MGKIEKQIIYNQIDLVFLGLFFISFFHSILCSLFYILLLYYYRFGIKGCIKVLILATTRGALNPALARVAAGANLKLAIILLTSVVIIAYAKPRAKELRKLNLVIGAILVYCLFAAVSSFIFSSYPTTAFFKIVSFAVPFIAILKGIACTYESYDWLEYFCGIFFTLFVISFLLIPFDSFRIVNDDFQGVFNHVNVFGILAALFIVAVLGSNFFSRKRKLRFVVILAVLYMIYLSASRTGLAVAVLVLITNFIMNKKKVGNKIVFLFCMFCAFILILIIVPDNILESIQQNITEFIWKNNSEDIWDSREQLIEIAKQKYEAHPLFGSGFMIPYIPQECNLGLYLGLQVEPGNIFWSVLGDTGIIGGILFVFVILTISLQGKLSDMYMLIGVIGINMGEMVFFSSNNISIILYFLIALYIFQRKKNINAEQI